MSTLPFKWDAVVLFSGMKAEELLFLLRKCLKVYVPEEMVGFEKPNSCEIPSLFLCNRKLLIFWEWKEEIISMIFHLSFALEMLGK